MGQTATQPPMPPLLQTPETRILLDITPVPVLTQQVERFLQTFPTTLTTRCMGITLETLPTQQAALTIQAIMPTTLFMDTMLVTRHTPQTALITLVTTQQRTIDITPVTDTILPVAPIMPT